MEPEAIVRITEAALAKMKTLAKVGRYFQIEMANPS